MPDIKYKILKMIYNSEDRKIDKYSILGSKIATPIEIQTNIDELSKAPFGYIKNITCSDKYTLTNEGVYAFESAKKLKSHEKICLIRDCINTVIAIAALVISVIAIVK